MSVFDGEMDYRSVTMVDYIPHDHVKSPARPKIPADDCLIVGLGRDALRPKETPRHVPDKLCPLEHEYYKEAVKRFRESNPKLAKKYFEKDIDPVPIEHEIQDSKRTEYLIKYCSRDLPFMSVNLARRARALQTLRLPDDIDIPDTSMRNSYRPPEPDKYIETPASMSMRPKYDNTLQKKLTKILRAETGETTYGMYHNLLGDVILKEHPYGPPRKEPRYGKWKDPYSYTYRL